MTSLIFPPSLTPKSVTWRLVRDVRVKESGSSTSRTTRGTPRWQADVTMPPLQDEERAIFNAFLAEQSRGDRSFYMHSHGESLRGSFDDAEILTNGDFTNGTTGWQSDGFSTLAEGSRLFKLTNTSTVNGQGYQDKNLTSGRAYCMIAHSMKGSISTANAFVFDYTGAATVVSKSVTEQGLMIGGFQAVNTGSHKFGLRPNSTVSGVVTYFSYASLAQCFLVNGGSQTGDTLSVKAVRPASTNDLLKIGDMFMVMIDSVPSLHRLTRDLDSGASGVETLFFEPALPGSPDADSVVVFRRPFCRMFLLGHTAETAYLPAGIGEFSFTCVEDVTR